MYKILTCGYDSLQLLPIGERSMVGPVFHVAPIVGKPARLLPILVLLSLVLGESPLLGDVDLLATGELELGTPQSLNNLFPKL